MLISGVSCRRSVAAGFVLATIVATSATPARCDRQAVLSQLAQMGRHERRDAADWDRRRIELREGFLKGAGLWPLPKQGPLSVVRHSLRAHDGYTVENVAIETLPGFYCTGNLYRPEHVERPEHSGRPEPGILCPHGHFKPLGRFRADQQIRCAQLARMGATVFSYSMVGWQDSRQTTHDDPLVLALQTWNSLKALDFLSSLDGVDPQRIGMTGASGGGTQTLYLALLDDRVRASAPVVILYPWSAPEGCCRCEGGLPIMREDPHQLHRILRGHRSAAATHHLGRPGPDVRFSESRLSVYPPGLRGVPCREPGGKRASAQGTARLRSLQAGRRVSIFADHLGIQRPAGRPGPHHDRKAVANGSL